MIATHKCGICYGRGRLRNIADAGTTPCFACANLPRSAAELAAALERAEWHDVDMRVHLGAFWPAWMPGRRELERGRLDELEQEWLRYAVAMVRMAMGWDDNGPFRSVRWP